MMISLSVYYVKSQHCPAPVSTHLINSETETYASFLPQVKSQNAVLSSSGHVESAAYRCVLPLL